MVTKGLQVIYKGAFTSPEDNLPVHLYKEGDKILPGEIELYDILLVPKAHAEVVQVVEITDKGKEAEAWDTVILPKTTRQGLPWKLSPALLNGKPDVTGAHRPLGVIRLGRPAPEGSFIAPLLNRDNGLEFVRVNRQGTGQLVLVGVPVNVRLRTLAKSLPPA